jgi:hypothetical protein
MTVIPILTEQKEGVQKKVRLDSLNPLEAFFFTEQAGNFHEAISGDDGDKIQLVIKKKGNKVEVISSDGKLVVVRNGNSMVVPVKAILTVSEILE